MPLARASMRGFALKLRLAVKGIHHDDMSGVVRVRSGFFSGAFTTNLYWASRIFLYYSETRKLPSGTLPYREIAP